MQLQCNYKYIVYFFALLSVGIGVVYYGQMEKHCE